MLTFYEPRRADLWFKGRMMADAETMSYNHAYGGTIPFPEERRQAWYDKWIARPEGKRYYRYLREDSGAFVGECSYRFDDEEKVWMADVVIFAPYRGKGYGSLALEMLCSAAKENGIPALYDEIAADNPSAALFLRHGFAEVRRTGETVLLRKIL